MATNDDAAMSAAVKAASDEVLDSRAKGVLVGPLACQESTKLHGCGSTAGKGDCTTYHLFWQRLYLRSIASMAARQLCSLAAL